MDDYVLKYETNWQYDKGNLLNNLEFSAQLWVSRAYGFFKHSAAKSRSYDRSKPSLKPQYLGAFLGGLLKKPLTLP